PCGPDPPHAAAGVALAKARCRTFFATPQKADLRMRSLAFSLPLVSILLSLATGCGSAGQAQSAGAGGGGQSAFNAKELAISHTFCALLDDKTVACWGFNQRGQLGTGTADQAFHATPERVVGLSDVVALRQGWDTTCAILGSGGVKCWGFGE